MFEWFRMNYTTQYPVHSRCLLADCHVRGWRGQRWHCYSHDSWQTANHSLSHTDIFKETFPVVFVAKTQIDYSFTGSWTSVRDQNRHFNPNPVFLTLTKYFLVPQPKQSISTASCEGEIEESTQTDGKSVIYYAVCASFVLFFSFCYVMSSQCPPSN